MKSFKLLVATMLLQMLSITNLSAETVEVNIDMTAVVGTDVTSWNAGGLCSTQYAPEVITADGRTAQMAESYEMTVETIDTLLFQIVTDLNNGTYTVVLYANALYTSGRGFESSLEEGATDVAYVFANGKSVPVTAGIGTETSTNGEYTLSDVKVTDGTLTMGLAKSKAGTNWHTIQIKSLILNNADFLLSYGQNTQQPWEAKCFYHEATDGSVTPGDNWYATDFDDSAWDNILGPISNSDNYYHATDWDSIAFTYWIRRHFTLESIPSNQNISLQVIHDDGCQIYLNGNLIYNNEGYLTSTSTITLTSEQKAYLREGDNVIAATVNNSGGSEAFIDFGMEVPTISEVGGIRYKGTIAYELTDRSLNEYVVKEGTTTINDNLFNDCNATSITLPNSLKTIENWAFHNCHNLKTINIPQNVKKIEYGAFYNCHALDSITYNAINCTSASNDIFYNCSNLKTIIIGDNVESIPANIFRDNDNLQKVTIGSNVKSIGDGAFYSCDNLKDINIPNSVEFIGYQAFYYCHNLKAINIPTNIKNIGNYAFAECYSLDSISFNVANLSSVPDEIFNGSNSIRVATIGNEVKTIPSNLFRNRDNLQKVTIGNNVTKIENYAFYNCYNLKEINIPNSVDSIGDQAFQYCNSLPVEEGIRYADCYAIEVTDKNQSQYTLKDSTRFLGSELFSYCYYMTSVNIPEGVKTIGYRTFYDCDALTSIVLPDGVKHIGNGAFYSCDNLTSVTLGSGVTTIGDEAFRECYNLPSLTLPDGVNQIGSYAFCNCVTLNTINIPSGVTAIADNTFQNCGSLKEVTLPEGITTIGSHAFYQCGALSTINIPAGVTAIKNRTFYDCSSLNNITLPNSLTSIEEHAFYSCDALTAMAIPSGVTSISNSAFQECYGLKEVTLPEGLTTIGESAFNYCHSLLKVDIPSTVTYIGPWAFYNCNQLLSIKLPEGLTQVGDYAFYSCSQLRDMELPSTLTQMGYNNLDAENLTINSYAATPPTISGGFSNKLMYVPSGSGAAYRELYPDNIIIDGEGTTVTVEVADAGTLRDEVFDQVEYMYEVNHLVVSGTIGDEDMEHVRNSMSNLISIDLSGVDMKTLPASFLYNKRTLIKAVLPENATEIGTYAFQYCTRLKEVVLPEGLEKINSQAFYECGLDTIVLPESLSEVGDEVFRQCYQLKSANLPASLRNMGSFMFYDCRSLESVTFSEGLTNIGYCAFENCSSLKSVDLPNSVTTIESYAFKNCNALSSITLPQELISTNYESFSHCNSLKYVEIPEKVTTIGEYLFNNCDGLDSVKILGASTINSYAFANCDSLKKVTLPYTLNLCSNDIFAHCNQLENVTCESLFPPTAQQSRLSPNSNCVLYVSDWTINEYKTAAGWSDFKSIKPITGVYPAAISINDKRSLTVPEDGLPETYKPYLSIVSKYIDYWNQQAGKLTVRGDRPLTLSTFAMQQSRDENTMTTLINKGSMSADSVVTKLSFPTNQWQFLSFPYDVKVSDIVYEGEWVIRYYDGEARAQGDRNTWKTVSYDSILHAGEGYIWHSTNGNFEVPAMNNDNKNNIFSNATVNVQLKEHTSSTDANSGWNLIGNPYPCYFDTRQMEFSSPITVRNGDSYSAYSPLDDSYILKPLEAFFVQCSSQSGLIGFDADGRQDDRNVRELSAPRRARGVNSNRSIFNLYLENENDVDHARFVINEEASCNYEMTCDASKFMSDNPKTAQLFTIENGEQLAINERPMANGEIALGIYIGEAGSYTLSLDARTMEHEAVLVDHFTGKETDIIASDYTFTSEAGTFTNRFSIRLKSSVVDEISNIAPATIKVAAAKGAINIYNATSPVEVYNAAGALVATQSGEVVTVEVTPGVYVIKVGTEAYKVSVVE